MNTAANLKKTLASEAGIIESIIKLCRLSFCLWPFLLNIYSASFYLGVRNGFFHALAILFANASIMVLNDLQDANLDTHHASKKFRPISNKKISHQLAKVLIVIGFTTSMIIEAIAYKITFLYVIYLLIGVTYTKYLKTFSWVSKNGFVAFAWVLNIYLCGAAYPPFLGVYVIIFLWGMRYEIISDMGDREADKNQNIKTLSHVVGLTGAFLVLAIINLAQWLTWISLSGYQVYLLDWVILIFSFADIFYLAFPLKEGALSDKKIKRVLTAHLLISFSAIAYFIYVRMI